MTRDELQISMAEALKRAHTHLEVISALQARAHKSQEGLDDDAFHEIVREQKLWELEMEKYSAANTLLMEMLNVSWD